MKDGMIKDIVEALTVGLIVSIPLAIGMALLIWGASLMCYSFGCPPPRGGW